LNGNAVGDFEWTARQRPAQRGWVSRRDLEVARDLQTEGLHMILEAADILDAAQAKDC
jgi:hypothetical protein